MMNLNGSTQVPRPTPPLTPEICEPVLKATSDVTFVPDVPGNPGHTNVVLFPQNRPDGVFKTVGVEGRASQLPADTRAFR